MISQTFGKWEVIKEVNDKHPYKAYLCRCVCGRESIVTGTNLRCGRSTGCKSCASRFHGMVKTSIYKNWVRIKARCNSPQSREYENYGGKGVKLYTPWNSFEVFYKDMGDKPEGLRLERIEKKGDYSPSNCFWGDKHSSVIGKQFGEWLVLEAVKHESEFLHYLCRCSCGFERVITGNALRCGYTKQCLKCKYKKQGEKHRGWSERLKRRKQDIS